MVVQYSELQKQQHGISSSFGTGDVNSGLDFREHKLFTQLSYQDTKKKKPTEFYHQETLLKYMPEKQGSCSPCPYRTQSLVEKTKRHNVRQTALEGQRKENSKLESKCSNRGLMQLSSCITSDSQFYHL